jgi:CheY-like chemotaxis protein
MDYNMPIMSGVEATRQMIDFLDSEKLARIPFWALTANEEMDIKKECYDVGMCEYCLKPVEAVKIKELLSKYQT